jgi:hypothetical protein
MRSVSLLFTLLLFATSGSVSEIREFDLKTVARLGRADPKGSVLASDTPRGRRAPILELSKAAECILIYFTGLGLALAFSRSS